MHHAAVAIQRLGERRIPKGGRRVVPRVSIRILAGPDARRIHDRRAGSVRVKQILRNRERLSWAFFFKTVSLASKGGGSTSSQRATTTTTTTTATTATTAAAAAKQPAKTYLISLLRSGRKSGIDITDQTRLKKKNDEKEKDRAGQAAEKNKAPIILRIPRIKSTAHPALAIRPIRALWTLPGEPEQGKTSWAAVVRCVAQGWEDAPVPTSTSTATIYSYVQRPNEGVNKSTRAWVPHKIVGWGPAGKI